MHFFGGDVFSCNIQVHTFEMLLISRFVIDDILQRCLPQQVHVQSHMFRTGYFASYTFHLPHFTFHPAPCTTPSTSHLAPCTLPHATGTLHALWHRTRNVIFDAALHGRVQPRWTADLEAYLFGFSPLWSAGRHGKPREAPPTFQKRTPASPTHRAIHTAV